LRDNSKINRQDPILIYYAGHGGEVPSNNEDKTQTLIPVDYVAEQIFPIPDRTVAALINGIAKKHGNNIVSGTSSLDPRLLIRVNPDRHLRLLSFGLRDSW
jgi:hypothetical protein